MSHASRLPIYNSRIEWAIDHVLLRSFADFVAQKAIIVATFVCACFGLLSFWWLLPVVVLSALFYPWLHHTYYYGERCFADGTGPRIVNLFESYGEYRAFMEDYHGDLHAWLKIKGWWQERYEGKAY